MFENHREEQIDEYGMRQIWLTKNQIFKNIPSLSRERVVHDPAELFV